MTKGPIPSLSHPDFVQLNPMIQVVILLNLGVTQR